MESSLYFALVEGNVCSCGDEDTFIQTFLDSYEEQTAGTCDAACPGSPDETCGGAEAYDLYRIRESPLAFEPSTVGVLRDDLGWPRLLLQQSLLCNMIVLYRRSSSAAKL